MKSQALLKEVAFTKSSLIPAIIQDFRNGEVLMLAYMNEQALAKTLATGKTHFWSRSRQKLWCKGESSGHIQRVRSIYLDCDGDALLIKVSQASAACHTGYYTCFYRKMDQKKGLYKVTGKKVFDPQKVYHK